MAGASAQRRDTLLLLYDRYFHDHVLLHHLKSFKYMLPVTGHCALQNAEQRKPTIFSRVSGDISVGSVRDVILKGESVGLKEHLKHLL